jgi:peptide/nickel transport system substrate-binding protein
VDDEKRAETIKQMQRILFEDSPYLVVAYTADGQAYRNDRFACFVPQPENDGVLIMQYGSYNYRMLRPADEAGDCDGVEEAIGAASAPTSSSSDDDTNNALLIGGAAVLVLLLAGGGVMAFRRRGTAGERE